MPEAPVDEDSDPPLRKNDIGPDRTRSATSSDRKVDTEPQTLRVEVGPHCTLKGCVSPAVSSHDPAPLVGDALPRAALPSACRSLDTRRLHDCPTGAFGILISPMATLVAHETESRALPERISRSDADADYLRRTRPPALSSGEPAIPIVDLFAGLGGLTLGALEGARRCRRSAQLALAIDGDAGPLTVMQKTLGGREQSYLRADIETTLAPLNARLRSSERRLLANVPAGSLLLAGPPCQGHSALNNHTRHDDPRNDLYLAVARAARLFGPSAVIVENVRGVDSDRRSAMSQCAAALEVLGYCVTARRLNLNRIGVPQTRVRHVLVATERTPLSWDLPHVDGRDVRWAIGDLLDRENATALDMPSTPTPANRKRIDWLFARDAFDLPNAQRPKCHRNDHSYRSMYGRLHWDEPAQTVTSGFGSMGQGRYVHPLRPRTLTPHEAARLQFLPDFVRLAELDTRTATAHAIGNAAPPRLTITLVEALIEQGLL